MFRQEIQSKAGAGRFLLLDLSRQCRWFYTTRATTPGLHKHNNQRSLCILVTSFIRAFRLVKGNQFGTLAVDRVPWPICSLIGKACTRGPMLIQFLNWKWPGASSTLKITHTILQLHRLHLADGFSPPLLTSKYPKAVVTNLFQLGTAGRNSGFPCRGLG